jgi:hypothetical protein
MLHAEFISPEMAMEVDSGLQPAPQDIDELARRGAMACPLLLPLAAVGEVLHGE